MYGSGLAAYPDEVWFDPNRPSWLPYWIDTPTESGRKYNTLFSGNPTPAASSTPVGVPTKDDSQFWLWLTLAGGAAVLFLLRS